MTSTSFMPPQSPPLSHTSWVDTLVSALTACIALITPLPLWLDVYQSDTFQHDLVWIAALGHVCAVGLTVWLSLRSPFHARLQHGTKRLGFTLLLLLFPVAGVLIVLFIQHQWHHLPSPPSHHDWLSLSIDSPPHQAETVSPGTTGLDPIYILLHSRCVNRKKKALQHAHKLPLLQTVRLLRLAITDTNDEIRLLGVSQLKRIENDMNFKLYAAKQRFVHADAQHQIRLALPIAQLYFDFLYLQICDQELRPHYLTEAHYYCNLALHTPSPEATLLAARIALMADKPETANHLLTTIKKDTVASSTHEIPYMAEIAFTQGKYTVVRQTLQTAPMHSRSLDRVRRFWQ